MKWQLFGIGSILLALQVGCSVLAPIKDRAAGLQEETIQVRPKAAPVTMAVIWKEAALESAGSLPVRGFTGRIYFYDQNDQPMQVEGELVVYAYDDSDQQSNSIPDRKYVFPAEKFQSHYSKSHLGHSYSVWLPWEKQTGIRKSITVMPIFKTSEGQIIEGTTGALSLSGRPPKKDSIEKTFVRRSGVERPTATEADHRQTVNSRAPDTFRLPPTLANRIANVRQIAPPHRLTASQPNVEQLDRAQNDPEPQYNQIELQKTTLHSIDPDSTDAGFTNFNDLYPPRTDPSGDSTRQQPTHTAAFGKPGSFR